MPGSHEARIRRALVSVHDKRGLVELARGLRGLGIEVLSTGGTARRLAEGGVEVIEVSDYTGVPEMLGGRVKTLHPRIHAALLARRGVEEDVHDLREYGIQPIGLVVVNLYPFEQTIARPSVRWEEAIETIDIGGPTMIRAAAKNFEEVAVVVDPDDYESVLGEIRSSQGSVSRETRFHLARKAFAHMARYDAAIANWLGGFLAPPSPEQEARPGKFPESLTLHATLDRRLRYGENPHQAAALYRDEGWSGAWAALARPLQGKELSYNNFLDLDAAVEILKEFALPAAVVVKHRNPCGAAVDPEGARGAFLKAHAVDPTSAFGGIVGVNRKVDAPTAEAMTAGFLEAVVAPAYDEAALALFARKKNLRVLSLPALAEGGASRGGLDLRRVGGGILVQDRDAPAEETPWKTVSRRPPTPEEERALRFVWSLVRHVRSNAVVVGYEDRAVGIGAGQMSRVDAVRVALLKSPGGKVPGGAAASEAFFPFRDGLDLLAQAGVTAVVEPGGSIRDAEVVAAADERGVALVFTGVRHFSH